AIVAEAARVAEFSHSGNSRQRPKSASTKSRVPPPVHTGKPSNMPIGDRPAEQAGHVGDLDRVVTASQRTIAKPPRWMILARSDEASQGSAFGIGRCRRLSGGRIRLHVVAVSGTNFLFLVEVSQPFSPIP